ncbi:MAG: phage tail protein [Kofleriaceae bacterium]
MPTGFTKNAHRREPYKAFKFRIVHNNKVVFGVSKVGALKRTTEVVKHRSGGQNSYDYKSWGRTTFDSILLERGITHDHEFEAWANMVATWSGDASANLAEYKRELTLEFLNERGQVAIRYFLHGCWVSEYTAVPELDANGNSIALETLKVELDGWERDPTTLEPDETDDVPSTAVG